MLRSLSPPRRRFVVATAGLLLVALLGLFAAWLVHVGPGDPVRAVRQDRPGPVLLVSGYGGRVSALDPLRAALEARGRTVVVVPPVDDGTGDLDRQAEELGRVAEATAAQLGAPSVDVVGYSAGGVVARLWVRDHGGGSLARRVLSVGSPQHGTDLAVLAEQVAGGCTAACRELAPGSALLRQLNSRDETPPGPVFVSVWSETDQVVVPPDTAALAGALSFSVQSVCPGDRAGHGDLPGDPVVLATAATVLGAGPPRRPSASVCRGAAPRAAHVTGH